jgi:hypothetical protein
VRQLKQATETGSAVYLNTFPRADVRVNSVRQLKQAATETGSAAIRQARTKINFHTNLTIIVSGPQDG